MSFQFQLKASDKISLRTYEVQDALLFYKSVKQEQENLRLWIPWADRVQCIEDAAELIKQGHQMIQEQSAMPLMIWYEDNFVGGVGFHNWDHNLQIAKIGYWLATSAQGKGIIKSSAKALIEYLFNTLQLHKIVLEYFPKNEKSAKVAKALGFTIEGLLRKTVKHQGIYHDLVVCGLLKDEWKNKII